MAFNNLTAINLSDLTNLEYLELNNNDISGIDLSHNTLLTKLDLSCNNLTSIDLSNNEALTELALRDNDIISIDLSNLTNLELVKIDHESLNGDNIDNLTNLERIRIYISLFPGESIDLTSIYSGINSYVLEEEKCSNLDLFDFEDNIVEIPKDPGYYELRFHNYIKILDFRIMVYDRIESNKYEIDYNNKYLYVGGDSNQEIINNIVISDDILLDYDEEDIEENNLGYKFKIISNDLNVIFKADEDVAYKMKYKLGRMDLSDYELNGKQITVSSDFDVDDIEHCNVELELNGNILIVKDLNGNEVDRYTVNKSGSNETPNNNDNEDNNVDDNSNNSNIIKDDNKTSRRTTLNKFENNAKTYDDIVKYFIIGGIAIILIIGIIIYTKRRK